MKVAFVTGGAAGIGRAIAARFASAGYRVAIADSDVAAGNDARDEHGVRFDPLDVADEAAVARVIAGVAAWGGGLDVVVNNAGIANPARRPLEELPVAEWRRVIDVNLTGMFLVARAAAPHLRARKGSIINITSTRAIMSEPNTFAYSASKGGATALTHSLAVSLGPDVRVNAIAPGWIATDAWQPRDRRKPPELRPIDHQFHPAGRVGTPEDIAALALFLASDDAGFITGQVITSDGGVTRKMIYPE
ncbi:MAG TPA: SDR family oxidoreductase [Kofleriaceae bacterium]|jgi:NAD(P)-dependent dehydrogenase (short-subunit alcohol dehydrogenase family)